MNESRSQLAVFDIDGTLTNTTAVDDECFRRAAADVLGVAGSTLDWSDAPHVTDPGVFQHLVAACADRTLDPALVAAMQERFLELLRAERAERPQRFAAMPGATAAFATLHAAGWDTALATGAWEPSARLKLATAGIDVEGIVLATSSDATTRTEILRLARQRTAVLRARTYGRIVSIGDGAWDVRAARELGWPFVGIATGARAAQLRACGAEVILPDLAERSLLLSALAEARCPRPPGALAIA